MWCVPAGVFSVSFLHSHHKLRLHIGTQQSVPAKGKTKDFRVIWSQCNGTEFSVPILFSRDGLVKEGRAKMTF